MTQPGPDQPTPDDLDWNSSEFGKMADYATDEDDEPKTVPYEPETDDSGEHA